ncbi:SDR family NAD(P)-dependent oxidoreductase [Paraburkholderia oxyphila]|uniref:SDR family NAD(P)-dependent oxidoreductase n=1 Tax=Paraburkholderia oxyphila TaxID=614212 RepID=UPI000483546C
MYVNRQWDVVPIVSHRSDRTGLHGFTMALALEVAKQGVTASAVSPGYLATTMVDAVPQHVMENSPSMAACMCTEGRARA